MIKGEIKRMLNPETIAVIGASEKEKSVGRTLVENLCDWSRERKLFPVNPNWKKVLGFDCYPEISRVPEHIDLALIATPAPTIPDIVEACGKADVEGLIVVSAGFREVGEEGRRLEEEIKSIRNHHGMRVIGPNCLGVIRPNIGLNASMLKAVPKGGNIAFISQSGALGGAIFDWAIFAHAGFSIFASLGSMIDVDFADLIDFLGTDPYTRSIMLYMEEGVGNAKKFMSAAKGFARTKPIIAVKPGRFSQEPIQVRSRASAMARSDRVYDAAFGRVGVVRVKEAADLFNTVRVLHAKHLPQGPRLAIVTNAIGIGVMATDALIELGGRLATISEESLRKLELIVPPYCSSRNPVDVYRDADIQRYVDAVQVCLSDPGVDAVLVIYTLQDAPRPKELAEAITGLAQISYKPILTTWIGGKEVQEGREILFQHSIPSYETPEEAVRVYLHMVHYKRGLELQYETPEELPIDQTPPKNNLKTLIQRAVKEGETVLNEEESNRFLVTYGIPVMRVAIVHHVEEAVRTARSLGYPVVLKVVSPDIVFRSDIGGVVLGVNSNEELRKEYKKLLRMVEDSAPNARITGVGIQKMIEKIDYEIYLGAKKDRDFGSVILFGMGGIGMQLFKDFSIALPPLNQILARRLMEETEIYRLLHGYGHKAPADFRRLEQMIVSFSNLIVDFPEIAEMDIHPIAISDGQTHVLNARIILDPHGLEYRSLYPHLMITPYPTRYVTAWNLPDGTEVTFRPIKPEDEPMLSEMLAELSEETLKERFFQVIKSITHEMLIRLCNIDYDREMTIAVEIRTDSKRKLIAIGSLMIEPDFKKGEFALVIHDVYQGKGIGYKLLDLLIGIAQEKGLEELYGIIRADNRRMLGLCGKLGFTVTSLSEGMTRAALLLK